MQVLSIADLLRATNGTIKSPVPYGTEIIKITTDSRTAEKGSLFIPLKGERSDGHDYIHDVLKKGAASLTEKKDSYKEGVVIGVADTRVALGDIARFYKNKYNLPTVSITGSVGKTTTKDLVFSVLSEHYKTHKTPNNFNNDIGVPLTLFGIEKDHEAAVVEMGMNHFGEISYLADIVKPDCAVITNIGMSHIENLGSQEGILKAKLEITEHFGKDNTLFINGDDEYLKKLRSDDYKIVRFGLDSANNVYAKNIVNNGLDGTTFTVVYEKGEFDLTLRQPGEHNIYNALAAVSVGLCMGVTEEECARGVENCVYTSSRLEVIKNNGLEIINDCYNSSPSSVRAALEVMSLSLKPRKVAVLGDILEMGEYAKDAHYKLGADVHKYADALITAGDMARYIADGAKASGMENVKSFSSTAELKEKIKELVGDGDCVLVKASHGMTFCDITEVLKES